MTDHELTRTMAPLFASPVSLDTFRRHGDDMIDRWDGRRFTRAVDTGDGDGRRNPSDMDDVVRRQFIVGDSPGEGWVGAYPDVVGKVPREVIESADIDPRYRTLDRRLGDDPLFRSPTGRCGGDLGV